MKYVYFLLCLVLLVFVASFLFREMGMVYAQPPLCICQPCDTMPHPPPECNSCSGSNCSLSCCGGGPTAVPPTATPIPCVPSSCSSPYCGEYRGCPGSYCDDSDDSTSYGSWAGGGWCGDGTDSRSASNPCSSPSSWTDYGSSWCIECGSCPGDDAPMCGEGKGSIDCSSCGNEPDKRDGTWNLPANDATFLHDDTITVSGVAKDTNDVTVGVDSVHVYRDGGPGVGVLLGSIPVNAADGIFSATYPANFYTSLTGSDHTLEVYAIKKDPTDCENWKIGNTRTIHITNSAPTTGTFSILDGSGAVACTDGTCNSKDFIVDLDTNYNQKVRVKAVFTDADIPEAGSGKVTDLHYAWIIFDNDTDSGNSTFYRIKFSNNADGVINATDMQTSDSGTDYDGVITIENLSASFDSGTKELTVYATMNLSSILKTGATGPFLSNIYLKTEDYTTSNTGRVLKAGGEGGWNVKPYNGIYPWTNGGPTSGWEGTVANRSVVCNENICWTYDSVNGTWLYDGVGNNISTSSAWSAIQPFNGIYPWTNGGPTSAWTSAQTNLTNVCNENICWTYDQSSSQWLYSGAGGDISVASGWSAVQAYNGIYPWTNGGPTSAWTNTVNKRSVVCNENICWTYDSINSVWLNSGAGADISTSWNVQLYNGMYPWSNSGPTSGWTSTVTNNTAVCNGGICWTYNQATGQWASGGNGGDIGTLSSLDIWNGKDISVKASRKRDGDTAKSDDWNAQFVSSCAYTVDAVDKTTQAFGIPSDNSLTGIFYLPYANYGGANNCTITMKNTEAGWYINGSDFTQFGGALNTRTAGQSTVVNQLNQAGASHNGRTIVPSYKEDAPVVTSLSILNSQSSPSCTDSSCSNKDLIVDLDDNVNKKLTFKAVFTDVNENAAISSGTARSDIVNAKIIFDTDSNYANGDIYRIKYTDSEDGVNYVLASENYLGNTSHYGAITISSSTAVVAGNTLTLQVTIDLSGMAKDGATGPIVGNLYTSVTDWAGTTTGRVLSASSFDIWNGKDVKTYSTFYEVNPNALCGVSTGTLGALIPLFDVLYQNGGSPYTYGGNGSSVTGETLNLTSSIFFPYYYYISSDIVSQKFGVNTAGEYVLSWIDASAYGGGCDKSTDGTVDDVSMKNGGALIAAGAVNNGLSQTFKVGLSQISDVWMQVLDGGTFYTHTNFSMDVPKNIFSASYLSYTYPQNGIVIVNGTFGGNVFPTYVGTPYNRYSTVSGGSRPVTAPSITNLNGYQSYASFKQRFQSFATIATTDSVISADPAGTIFMYDQNLSITSNITVPVDSYKIFIVNGNLTIDSGVDTLEGIYLVFGNLTVEDDGLANYDRSNITGAFTLTGSLMVQGTLTIERTLGAANDAAVPFSVIYNPAYMYAMTQDPALTSLWQQYKYRMGE